jgi:glc operon protein GlcG
MSQSENVRPASSIALAAAQAAIAAGVDFAKGKGLALSFVVVDSAGHLVASARMDGAAFITVDIARGKAFASAATGGQPGFALAKRFHENPMVWGNAGPLGSGAPMLPAQGSLPIFFDKVFVGAMGASGAPSEVDEAAIAHAVAAIGGTTSRD